VSLAVQAQRSRRSTARSLAPRRKTSRQRIDSFNRARRTIEYVMH
jgi:hypothetical protein